MASYFCSIRLVGIRCALACLLLLASFAFKHADALAATPPNASAAGEPAVEGFEEIQDKAVREFLAGRFTEALTGLDRAIRLNPNSALARYNRGNVHYALKDYPSAVSDYGRAIELRPDFALAFMNRGSALSNMGRLVEALADLDKAAAVDPSIGDVFFNRAVVLLKLGRIEDALNDYDRLLVLDRSAPDAAAARSRLKRLIANEEGARSKIDAAIYISEFAHGRRVEFLMDLVQRSCLSLKGNAAELAMLAEREGWHPIPSKKLEAEGALPADILGAWSMTEEAETYYVMLTKPKDADDKVCSVSTLPIDGHLVDDLQSVFADRFTASKISEADAADAVFTIDILPGKTTVPVAFVRRDADRFLTLRTLFQNQNPK